MTDLRDLWDFDDAAGSEQRLRAAAEIAEGDERLVLLTQVARALGLQERYDEGHALLDDLAVPGDEVAARVSLERGRLLRSAGDEDAALPHFEAAEAAARDADLDALRIDAIHMLALVGPVEQRIAVNERALELAGRSTDPEARDWDASLLTNIGMVHADAGDFAAALAVFEQALVARERIGTEDRTRVARWMVAWALRNLGHRADALTISVSSRRTSTPPAPPIRTSTRSSPCSAADGVPPSISPVNRGRIAIPAARSRPCRTSDGVPRGADRLDPAHRGAGDRPVDPRTR